MLKALAISTVISISLTATAVSAGTFQQALDYRTGGCVTIPRDVACLSACAFAWLKGDVRSNQGIVGFHWPYDPVSHETSPSLELAALFYMLVYDNGLGVELDGTTPRHLFIIKGEGEGKLLDWRPATRGYRVVSDPSGIRRCD